MMKNPLWNRKDHSYNRPSAVYFRQENYKLHNPIINVILKSDILSSTVSLAKEKLVESSQQSLMLLLQSCLVECMCVFLRAARKTKLGLCPSDWFYQLPQELVEQKKQTN
ncbi:hypothetical protein J1N35_027500 [Gossypium stocksii]|uniref:Uncharacterized protein n=1 Tax=Gossypium stocksii TaxID=47602 RepID=A0A9D3VA68_9ROSI|nr:hypothetical protein J1N35_027500 [Gossypium stocksii]